MNKILVAIIGCSIVGGGLAFFIKDDYNHHYVSKITNPDQHNEQMYACIKVALDRHPGAVKEVELELEDGEKIFDIDIQGKDDKSWEVECSANDGKVVEDEIERK